MFLVVFFFLIYECCELFFVLRGDDFKQLNKKGVNLSAVVSLLVGGLPY